MNLIPIAMTSLIALQVPQQEAGADRSPLTKPVVMQVVGDKIITQMEILSFLQQLQMRGQINSQEDRAREGERAFTEIVQRALQAQAGKDMGYAPELVRSLVEDNFKRRIEGLGGPAVAGAMFEENGYSPEEMKQSIEDDLLARAWRDSRLGKNPGATGRVSIDRYIRPGMKYHFFTELNKRADLASTLGGEPERVRLQEMHLLPAEGVSMDDALDKAETLRDLIESGEAEFERLDDLHGAHSPGWDPAQRVQEIPVHLVERVSAMRHGDRSLEDFLVTAKQGDVSPPLIRVFETGEEAVVLYLYEGRLAARETRFVDAEVQSELTKELERQLDDRRLSYGMEELRREAYLWPPPVKMPRETATPQPGNSGAPPPYQPGPGISRGPLRGDPGRPEG